MGKVVYIAEKPDIAKAIEKGLGGGFSRQDGYFQKGDVIVTWAIGHLLQIDKKAYKGATLDSIPIKDSNYTKTPSEDKAHQVSVIKRLVSDAELIVNAGDVDEEGQLIVDGLLRYFGNTAPVKRVLIADFTDQAVKKSLGNLQDNTKWEYMGWQAEARAIADMALGLNLSIAATKVAQLNGSDDLLSIGRVQSATLGLIVRRDREHKNHQKQYYHTVKGSFVIGQCQFPAGFMYSENTLINNEPVIIDEKGRLINKAQCLAIEAICQGKTASVLDVKTTHEKTAPPLTYNLLELQVECSKRYGYSSDLVLQITQSLRDNHKLITYNRSDTPYLSTEQYKESPSVLNAVQQNSSQLASMVAKTDTSIKSRAFDDRYVTAHTGIIPTTTVKDLNELNEKERNIYNMIARNFIAQFYPNYEYDKTKVTVACEGYQFGVVSNIGTKSGWKVLFGAEEIAEGNEDLDIDLRTLAKGDAGQCRAVQISDKETQPRPLYTEDSLLVDLTRSANYIKDPKLAKILKERDKDKKGEHGGIGTPATRHTIIKTLFERGFIETKNKKIVSTPLGQTLYDFLPDSIRYPDMTAIWTQAFGSIKSKQDVLKFLDFVHAKHIDPEVERFKANRNTLVFGKPKPSHPCPKCGRKAYLKDGKFGKYWGCSGWNDKTNPCDWRAKDLNGKPDLTPKAPPAVTEYTCKKCGKPLIKRTVPSKKKKGETVTFYGCSGFPSCKESYFEKDGQPNFDKN